jgi:hypothetical protein
MFGKMGILWLYINSYDIYYIKPDPNIWLNNTLFMHLIILWLSEEGTCTLYLYKHLGDFVIVI